MGIISSNILLWLIFSALRIPSYPIRWVRFKEGGQAALGFQVIDSSVVRFYKSNNL